MSASSSPELADEFEISSFDVAGFAANALRDWQSLAGTLDHTLLKPRCDLCRRVAAVRGSDSLSIRLRQRQSMLDRAGTQRTVRFRRTLALWWDFPLELP